MKKKVTTKTTFTNLQSKPKVTNKELKNKYFSFFEHIPIALWIEDFSRVKTYFEKIKHTNITDVKSYITNNPKIIQDLNSLIVIKEVNATAVKLYKAKNKQDLINNALKIFNEKSQAGFSKLLLDILTDKKESSVETINKTLTGEDINVLVKFSVEEDSKETLENVIITIEDITERIKTSKKLAKSEKRYREAQEIAKIGSWNYKFSTNKIHWSDEVYKLMEIKPQSKSLTLDFYLSHIHMEDRNSVKNFSIDFLLKNPLQNLQYRIITKKGNIKYINEKRSVQLKNGRIVKIIGICQDITESVLSEQKLNTTKNLFSNTLSSIKDGFVILDKNSNYLYINKEAENLLNIKNKQALIGKNIWIKFPEKEGDTFFDNYHKALETGKPISFENYFKPWNRWFENRIIPSKEGMLLFFHEITEKKETENKIKEAYNIINKSSSVAILCENKRDFPVEFASENMLDLFGYTNAELLSNKVRIFELVYPKDLEYIRSEFFKLLKSENIKTIKPKPFRILTKKGTIKWVKSSIDTIRNENNVITHIQGITEDFTEQKKIQDLFIESNQRIQDQFNNTPLASIIWDLNFNVLEWNNSAKIIFGFTEEEAKEKPIKDLITPPYLASEMKEIRRMLLLQKDGFRNTNENRTKSGKIIICDWYNVGLKDAKGKLIGMASLVDDITERVNTKKLIEKSEKKYRDIFEKSTDAVLIIKKGIFVDCNESTLKIFGYKNKEALLQNHPSVLSPKNQSDGKSSYIKAEEMMTIALEKGSNRFRWNHKKKNGEIFTAEVSLTRIDDADTIPTIHTVLRDISERVKKEKIESILFNISKAATTINDFKEFSLFIKNELHKLIDTNNFYIALYNKETDIIKTPVFVDEKEDIEEFSAKNTLTGYVINTKKTLMLNEESQRNFIIKERIKQAGEFSKVWLGVPLKIKEEVFGAIVVQSYINEKAYSKSDVQLLEFVADQISSIIQRKKAEDELKTALIKAQESDKLKSSFLANMSHEIRTPMNGIIGFSELLLDSNLPEKEKRKYAKIVINSSKQLLSIVNDILDISKIEAGVVKLNYESVNLNKLLDNLNEFYKPRAKDSNLKLNLVKGLKNIDSIIEIDKSKLNQVLTNLLSNAFKFTNEGRIEFGYQLLNSELQFYVKDTGVGIEENLQNKIFDRFIQANPDLNKKLQGTGLGLAISKKFVELFKGEIWLKSNSKGTIIYFTIPYVKSKTPLLTSVVEEQKKEIIKKNNELTILVAEDEEYNMLFINELFSKTNYKILEANNGAKALELVNNNNNKIDLVLMDIKMPIMDGNTAMKEIKKVKPSLPIIALSAFAMESDKTAAISKGFDSYLTKPIEKKRLFKILKKYTS
ncbi:PAS domain S-box protein [Lutibacter sp.]